MNFPKLTETPLRFFYCQVYDGYKDITLKHIQEGFFLSSWFILFSDSLFFLKSPLIPFLVNIFAIQDDANRFSSSGL